MNLRGRDGLTIDQAWAKGRRAYRMSAIPGFPNLFTVLGPNSPTGSISLQYSAELTARYITAWLERFAAGEFDTVEVTEEATTRFNDAVTEAMGPTVWNTGCNSWYFTDQNTIDLWPFDRKTMTSMLTEPDDRDFYLPPTPLPTSTPRQILRSENFSLALAIPGQEGQVPANATRIMYLSADTHGAPAAVTGTYLEPTLPWSGPGPRPLIAVAPGTQGQGDQCAPSKGFAELIHYSFPLDVWVSYEMITAYSLLARGMAVVMTDYYGLGTPAVHDYVNRAAEAHAVLDSIRAA